jgi:hypothetical protein
MAADGIRTKPYSSRLTTAGASVTASGRLRGLVQDLHVPHFWLVSSTILVVGAVSAVWLAGGANFVAGDDRERDALEELRTRDLHGTEPGKRGRP